MHPRAVTHGTLKRSGMPRTAHSKDQECPQKITHCTLTLKMPRTAHSKDEEGPGARLLVHVAVPHPVAHLGREEPSRA